MNINFTLKHQLCTGCGICEGVCPTKSINMVVKKGLFVPVIDESTCINSNKSCHRCYDACPGVEVPLKTISEKCFDEEYSLFDIKVGRYLNSYVGYSNSYDIRYHSSSGGMLSQFLIYLLEKEIIQGAVVTAFSKNDNITPEPFIARNKEDVLKAKGSKYCPVAFNKVGNQICKEEGKFVIVGLPCHIHGFRKMAIIDNKFSNKVLGYFALYCSSNRNYYAMDYLFQQYNINKSDISYFSFRDEGCLGNMVIKFQKKKPFRLPVDSIGCTEYLNIPYTQYYQRLRSFFKPRRCLSCIDHYGILADVSFGDIHIKPYSDDKVGINSLVTRNAYFDDLLKQAKSESLITLDELDVNVLNESQKTILYPRMRKAKALMDIDKLMGRKTVEYDITITENPSIKDYLSVIIIDIQRFIGNHSWLWWLINLSNIMSKHGK